jgi:flagellar P-ring protein precursor FlgI
MRLLPLITLTLGLTALAAQDPTAPATPTQPAAGGSALLPLPAQAAPARSPIQLNGLGETVLSPRIRNITEIHNMMPHKLVGVGLVTGLAKTGSSDRGTRQAILNMLRKLNLNYSISEVVGGQTSLVTVTAELPPFAKAGQRISVSCEIMTDAESLRGGTLLPCELKGVDGKPYAVASGRLVVAGYSAVGQKAQVKKNPSGTAILADGGQVIREEECSFYSESGSIELRLRSPSPFNAMSIARGIQTALEGTEAEVSAVDSALVRIDLPERDRTEENAMKLLAMVGDVRVPVENPTKVTVDQASGIVLAGEGVLISPCVVGLSELTITIVEDETVFQPGPFSRGETARLGSTRVEVSSRSKALKKVGGAATVADLLQNLEQLEMTPEQLVSVFMALDQGGFLHARLEVQ